jgi:taurine dioxygenase
MSGTATASRVTVEPLGKLRGAVIRGLDAANLSEADRDFLRRAFKEHAVLILKNQTLDEEQQKNFAAVFGPISDEGEYGAQMYVGNVKEGSLTPHGELAFHMDHSWSPSPLRAILLHALEVPPKGAGGETLFADVGKAYARLPDEVRRRIEGLQIIHSYPDQSKHVAIPGPDPRPGMPTAKHPIVMAHPLTGEKLLLCSPRHFDRIEGWDHQKGIDLAMELATYINQPEIVYSHSWEAGDLVVWDNLQFQHARTDFDRSYRRNLRRTQVGAPARG